MVSLAPFRPFAFSLFHLFGLESQIAHDMHASERPRWINDQSGCNVFLMYFDRW